MPKHWLSLALWLLIPAPAFAASTLAFGTAPQWVKPAAASAAAEPQDNSPLHTLLDDEQLSFHDDTTSVYSHTSVRINQPEGLQKMGTVALEWRPDSDQVTIHQLAIRRGGQLIDVLAAGQKFTILRRENNLEMAMIDGELTAELPLEGLQVGDIVEFAYTIDTSEPLLGGHHDYALDLGSNNFTGRLNLVARWSASHPVQVQALEPPAPLHRSPTGLSIQADSVQPVVLPQNAPNRFRRGRLVEFSDFRNWAEVADTFTPLYTQARHLPAQSPLWQEIDRIKAASADPATRASAALALVESQVRYLYIGLKQSNLRPAAPDETWQRRFGDCKGKTALLLALLDGLGIQAEPALVSMDQGDGMDERLPNAGQFDHVMVRATIAGRVYWLDGTREGDSSIADLPVPGDHWALPLAPGTDRLEALIVPPLTDPSTLITLRIDASRGIALPATIHADAVYTGEDAMDARESLASTEKSKLADKLKDFWHRHYDYIKIATVDSNWDAATHTEHLVMDGTATLDWNRNRDTPYFELSDDQIGWRDDTSRDAGPNADAPISVNYPYYAEYHNVVILPGDGGAFSIFGADVDETLVNIHLFRKTVIKGNVVTLVSYQKPLAPEVSLAQLQDAVPHLRDLAKVVVGIELDSKNYLNTTDEDKAVVASSSTDEASFQKRIDANYRLENYAGGLAEAKRYLAAFPHAAQALGSMAQFSAALDHSEDAANYAKAALAIDPNNSPAKYADAYGVYRTQFDAGNFGTVLQRYRTLELEELAQNCYNKQDYGCADTYTRRAIVLQADAPDLYHLLAITDLAQNQPAQATQQADHLVQILPKDPYALYLAGTIYCQANRCDRALELFNASLAIKPLVKVYLAHSAALGLGNRQQRDHDIDEALKLDPHNRDTLMVRANYQQADRDPKGEIATLQNLLSQPSGNLQQDFQLKIALGNAYATAGQPEQARETFAEVRGYAAGANSAMTYNNLCWGEATANFDLATAKSDCQQALAISPDTPAALDSLGMVELRLGNYTTSIADYSKALAKRPNQYASLFGRGVAHAKHGDLAEELADLSAAVKLNKNVAAEFQQFGIVP